MDDEEGEDDTKEGETPGVETDTAAATPIAETPLETPDSEAPVPAFPHAPTASSGLANPPITATTESAAASNAPTPNQENHHSLPSNAIELTNTAPGHTEEGQGDLGGTDVGFEVHVPEAGAPTSGSPKGGEDMDMDGSKEPPVESDAGLVHGEMDPPVAELAVEGGDHPPPEVEES